MNPFLADIFAKTGGLIHKHSTVYNGVKVEFHVKELPASEVTKLYAPLNTEDADAKAIEMQKLPQRIIAAVVCKEDGSPLFTEDEAAELPNALAMPFREKALKANGLSGEVVKEDASGKA